MSEHKLNLSDAVRNAFRQRYLRNRKLKLPAPALYLDCKDSRKGYGRNADKRRTKEMEMMSHE